MKRLLIIVTLFFIQTGIAPSAEIKLLAAGVVQEVFAELVPKFEESSGNKVMVTWTGGADIRKRIAAGEQYDVVVTAGTDIDTFIEQGKMPRGSRVDLIKSGIGVGTRAGSTKPDISSGEALKKTLLSVRSIGYSTGASGVYLVSLIAQMGISDAVKPKLKEAPSGVRIGTLIASGDAEIGFQQISELIHEPGVDYLGPLPADVQKVTIYSAGISNGTKQIEAAMALVKSITAPDAASVIKQHGMEPG
ncbi:molybdate ABC transporter substrate-binding protein [Rhodopseudomonas sp. P2A-2r]|uniref:molybdate ABC transporter substrate-binding protein n=1 Tax=unclassified Rhodopseudomonas TaxID=2638247 RepID=UPI002233E932|nr:substrate-binding domain-containing protein [Rhodopseudomonas sp. P2A-2r]UZE49944.1 substrate-binding domain-containing protein [Rhodopseudomonas sp. P2A-2r]